MSPGAGARRSRDLDARSDLYALGAILFDCSPCARRSPAAGDGDRGKSRARRSGPLGSARGSRAPPVGCPRRAARRAGRPGRHARRVGYPSPWRAHPRSLAAVVRKAWPSTVTQRYRTSRTSSRHRGLSKRLRHQCGAGELAGKRALLAIKRNKTASLSVSQPCSSSAAPSARKPSSKAAAPSAKAIVRLVALRRFESHRTATCSRSPRAKPRFQHYESALKKTDAALALDPTLLPRLRGGARWLLLAQERLPEALDALRTRAGQRPRTNTPRCRGAPPRGKDGHRHRRPVGTL